MKRRKFIHNMGLASLSAAFPVNGIMASMVNALPLPLTGCDEVNDRVLVIVRLAGANDGLNMCLPLNQYAAYAALRPTVKLQYPGQNNGAIMLDSTLPANQQIGLHPVMTGMKQLYDAGKLSIINAIGYPNFNYSHFDAENIIWSGKDGNYSGPYDEGMIGKFLDATYPNISGHPSPAFADPLVLHLGEVNPILSFVHDHGDGSVEYNAYNLQDYFNGSLNLRPPIPVASEYYDLLGYITGVEQGMDLYYNRVVGCFSNGTNSSVTYPNTYLGRQMKTVARILKGGSRTKIFQCTLPGFDTHANQVVSGSAHQGQHANLLYDLSASVKAFYDDITAMGFGSRITTITFSEFGRKPMENGGLGTDHGNISPMLVIGDAINPGIMGVNPNLQQVTAAPDGRFLESERQFDYRQVYGTLFQDWLGASNNILNQVGVASFQKLNIIQSAQKAPAACQRDVFMDVCTGYDNVVNTVLMENTVINGWTYYSVPGNDAFLFGVETLPAGNGANTQPIVLEVTISELMCAPNNAACFLKTSSQEGIFASRTYFNIKLAPPQRPNGWVNIRWFLSPVVLSDLSASALAFKNSTSANYISPVMWLKKKDSRMVLNGHLRDDGAGILYAVEPMSAVGTTSVNGQTAYQFNQVSNIVGTGGAAFIRVSNLPTNDTLFQVPSSNPSLEGQLRFNPLTKTFEGHNGVLWKPLH